MVKRKLVTLHNTDTVAGLHLKLPATAGSNPAAASKEVRLSNTKIIANALLKGQAIIQNGILLLTEN